MRVRWFLPATAKSPTFQPSTVGNEKQTRLSIFLSVFDVHVNRSPIAGVIRDVRYQRGQYLNAMNKASAELNEQNIVTVRSDGDGQTVVFKQIAGLLARRIVFYPKVGDRLERGQRVGLIKFGSRVDVLLDASARVNVKVGDRVKGGASVLAYLQPQGALAAAGSSCRREGALMDQPRPQTAPPAQQGDVHSPVAVYHREHGAGLLRHSRGHARHGSPSTGTSTTPPRRLASPCCSTGSMAASPA